ncbi:MAG: hypothetical protein J6M31_00040 [Bacteroidales bacterium]|nr:hypothetical protein [Bacteroidales bacterium]
MIGLEMAGISNKWILALATLALAFSCTREAPLSEPQDMPGEYDPVVRFGLETYMGPDNATKTTYAGDDQTILLSSVRYERINWNVDPSATDVSTKADTIRVLAEANFTKNKQKTVDYNPVKIVGVTNQTGSITSESDAAPISGSDNDNLYWTVSDKPRYFYAVYPSPQGRPSTYKPVVTISDPNTTDHSLTVSGTIPRDQKYVKKVVDGKVVEYLPNMADAYMYAAAKVPVANAGYKKVPLKFKPLFTAVKLMVTASGVGAQGYRLKKVELRTDLFYSDLYQGDLTRVNNPGVGTALNGPFTAKFSAETTDEKTPAYTDNFTLTAQPTLSTIADTTYKRLTIRIPEADRVWLKDNTVKLTFLALPIDQTVMTVVYTFEQNDGYGNPVLDDQTGKPVEVTRYLCLQQKTDNTSNTGTHSEFRGNDWYTLSATNKLYVRSNVPEIQYYFDVETQGNFPRTWRSGSATIPSGAYKAKDFYSVVSYRDSSGVLQPLRWKVTGYKPQGASAFSETKPATASWLNLRGDDPWTKTIPFDVEDIPTFDPWDKPQGQGSQMKNAVVKNGITVGYREFNPYSATFYDAGAPDNASGYARYWDWENPVTYNYMDAGGSFFHPVSYTPNPGYKGEVGEAYAFDLSSHDIYGNLYTGFKNGDLGTTANCYVVSAPGWYRLPAVYGCAIQNGVDKSASYTGTSGQSYILDVFLDHLDNPITNAWIPYTLASADVVWDDANTMVASSSTKTSRADRTAFCKTHNGRQYVYFYVDDIAQGNAVIAAKDASGIIVWSWHIWAVSTPLTYLKEVALESNQTRVSNMTPVYKSIYNGVNTFWKDVDLGQNGKESSVVNCRYCDVEFTQYFKGKVVQKIIRRFLQSGVDDSADVPAPLYQWGRKDPMRSDKNPDTKSLPGTTVENIGATIQYPGHFFTGSSNYNPSGKRYDNLWNTNVGSAITNNKADGSAGASTDRYVEKTIYDPSPPGFSMPNLYAYSGINPWSPIHQYWVPNTDEARNGIAVNPKNTFPQGYVDFYCGYNGSTAFRRNTSGETIRFYVTGRRKGNDGNRDRSILHTGDGTNRAAFYWTSEPAWWSDGTFYSRALWFSRPEGTSGSTNQWQLGPVAGAPRTNQEKWQRTHGLAVRPMRQVVSSTSGSFGGSNMNYPINNNPF